MRDLPAVDITQVLNEEAQLIAVRQERVLERGGQPALGVSFSGGGIRSATFHLGILQGIAQCGLLPRIDYLSTVSGGGYIGTWLHGVIKRYGHGDPRGLERLLTRPESEPHTEPGTDPIAFLRKYSSYLAPDIGLFSADFWVVLGIWTRNVMLNQLILVPFLAALSMLIFFIGSACGWYLAVQPSAMVEVASTIALLFVIVVIAGKGVGAVAMRDTTGASRKGRKSGAKDSSWDSVGAATACAALILLASLGTALASEVVIDPKWLGNRFPAFIVNALPPEMRWLFIPVIIGLVQSVLFLVLQWQGRFDDCFRLRHRGHSPWFGSWGYPLFAGLATGFVFFGCMKIIAFMDTDSAGSWNTVAWGPPLLALAVLAGGSLHVGLMGVDYGDNAREWLARVGAMVALFAFTWAALFTISVYGPLWISGLAVYSWKPVAGLGGGWLATSAAGALSGKSTKTGEKCDGPRTSSKLELISNIAPTVFIVGYLLLISFGMHVAIAEVCGIWASPDKVTAASGAPEWVLGIASKEKILLEYLAFDHECVVSLELLLGVSILCWYLPRRIDINEFSMHHFYKNRLVRCYLGATQGARRNPSRFTGFDPGDDIPVANFTPASNYLGPYAIVNGCLNLNRGTELAKKERRGSAFLFTPLYCGFDPPESGNDEAARQRSTRKHLSPFETEFWRRGVLHAEGYRRTAGYGYPDGHSIGTCMAISGAAANPNGGYHTSGPVAFLMTLFNVRLGWWVGNTRRDGPSARPGPHHSLMALLAELFAFTDARSNFLNLSDGGHFENLGLYELVRRRCRYIIAGDGEEDGGYTFASLGGAVRKCRTDFGVEIEIDPSPIRLNGKGLSGAHCVMGRIVYALRPGEAERQTGWLFYLKASLTGDEPEDVAQYKFSYPDFPQQPTANQFFTESQFESYRKLGRHVWESALADINPEADGFDLDRIFADLERVWNPRAAVREETKDPHGITIAE